MKKLKLTVICLFCALSFVVILLKPAVRADDVNTHQFQLDITDPTVTTNPAGANYPGLRGGDQLIRYTPAFGKTTGTNEYGAEITVIDGIVVMKTGSNSIIPENGYVLSGHGSAKKWLNTNTIIGTFIDIAEQNNMVSVRTTSDSYIYAADQMIIDAEKSIMQDTVNDETHYLQKARQLLQKAKDTLLLAKASSNPDDIINKAQEAYRIAEQAYYNSIPVYSNQERGVWVRPAEKTDKEIIQRIQKIADAGINTVYLETFYHGYTIYPSKVAAKYGIETQTPFFKGSDPLKLWIKHSKANNIKVIPWIETFYTGTGTPGPILTKKPEWANIQKLSLSSETLKPSTLEAGAYFIDPANTEARQYVIKIIEEIVKNYDVAGINLDYIRYPTSKPEHFPDFLESTWGYTETARKEFLKLYEIDPFEISHTCESWHKWEQYRQNQVNRMVKDVYKALKIINPDLELSAVIFPDYQKAKVEKLQDWHKWVNKGYIDALTPIILGSSPELVGEISTNLMEFSDGRVKIYTGIFGAFNNDLPIIFIKQIQAANRSGINGINIFDLAHLEEEYIKALKEGPFKGF